MHSRTFLTCLCAFSLMVPAPAQTPASTRPQSAPEQPVIEVSTHLVQVSVAVHGKKDEPLTNLAKSDFAIYDNGVKQQVATLTMESAALLPASAKAAPLLPVNTFTNRTELRINEPKAVTVILLDGLNTAFGDQIYAKKQLIKFLRELRPEDHVALYQLGINLQLLYDFTNDAGPLLGLLDKTNAYIGSELAESVPDEADTGDKALDQFLNRTNQPLANYQNINRTRTTLAAIEAIAKRVARVPGRKNLIWISGGFPFAIGLDGFIVNPPQEKRPFSEETERTARAVDAANLAIYPVDARALVGQPDASAERRSTSNGGALTNFTWNVRQTQNAMRILAERTGGRAYMNSNDLKSAIRNAIDDSRVSYVLSYYPAHNAWDGKWHNIKVACSRKDVEIRYRMGYFAFEDRPLTSETRLTALREAVLNPLDETTVGLLVRVATNVPKEGLLGVVIGVAVKDLQLQLKDDKYEGSLDMVFVKQPAAG